ncbi:MAG: protein translocase subunit SecF, partial [Planctomycetota bacterium]
ALAVVLDNEVYSAPNINSTITKQGIITGDFTPEQVNFLVQILREGSLPTHVNPDPVAQSSFGPAIGAANREQGIRAAYIGMIAVAVFMLIYYLWAGLLANAALVLNILLILGAMSLLSAVFTLPGIAGVILTIGIAVDANVLIFERLREEQQKGQPIRMALKNAYDRAFSAIFDANLTTLIVCLILGWVGTEEVRGFAITLGLGVAFSMFSALLFTRWIFQALLDLNVIKGPIKMLHLIGTPKVNWMKKRGAFWAVSGVIVVLGLVSLGAQGSDIWGIEFSSGTQAVVDLKQGALVGEDLPRDDRVREAMERTAQRLADEGDAGEKYRKFLATARVEERYNPNKIRDFLTRYDTQPYDGVITREEFVADAPEGSVGSDGAATFFAAMDANDDGKLTGDELAELPPFSYQVSTTEVDVDLIRNVIREAFGNSLQVSPRREFQFVQGQTGLDQQLQEEVGVQSVGPGGLRITDYVIQQAAPEYADELTNYAGGVLMMVKNVDPALTTDELKRRIESLRLQDEYRPIQFNQAEVQGLLAPSREGFENFLVLVRPAQDIPADGEEFDFFAREEGELLSAALRREQAIPTTNFDAQIAGETRQMAAVAVVLSWLAIIAYLWFRFGSVRWGVAAVVCLIHDVVIVVGLVAASNWLGEMFLGEWLGITPFKVDLPMIAAILTVIGYSVNDTIVVFDRIRENRGKLTTVTEGVINRSINETLSRTLLTSGTTFLVVLTMYVAGGAGIHAFSFALLVGVIFGTYSSIAVASPLLLGFRHAVAVRAQGVPVSQRT